MAACNPSTSFANSNSVDSQGQGDVEGLFERPPRVSRPPPDALDLPQGCTSYGLFRPSFLQGFCVNCSGCRRKNNPANAKCYECNQYLCRKCTQFHRTHTSHNIYEFDSLVQRYSGNAPPPPSPQPNGDDRDSAGSSGGNNSPEVGNDGDDQQEENHASSRVVGAGRRERSRNFSLPNQGRQMANAIMQQAINVLSALTLREGATNNSFFSTPPLEVTGQSSTNQEVATVSTVALGQGDSHEDNLSLPLCLAHNEEYRFFCTTCHLPLCFGCLQARHTGHGMVYIEEALQNRIRITDELNGQIKEVNTVLRQSLDSMQRMCESVDFRSHQVSIDARCVFRRFIAALEARQEDVLHRIEQARRVKLGLIGGQMENIRMFYARLARSLDAISSPTLAERPLDHLLANNQAFRELASAKNLGPSIYPCEDDGIMFTSPSKIQLQAIAVLGQLNFSSGPATNSVALCMQPVLYMNARVGMPHFPLPSSKYRPIFGCGEIIFLKDFGRTPKMMFGRGGNGDGELCRPWGVTINRFGHFIVADRSNNRIQVFDMQGEYMFQFGSHGNAPGQFERPSAVALNPHDDMVIADKDNHRIQVFNRNGEFLFTFGERGSQIGQFMYPWDVTCDTMGNILVSDARNHRIQLFRWNGIFITKWGGDPSIPRIFDTPRGVTFDPMGNILMTDFNMHRVVMIERVTGKVRYIGREGRERGQFNRPQGICCDDRGWFTVADSRNYRFQVFNEKGEFMWMVGKEGKKEPAEFDRPCDVCVDPEGHIYVMDFGNERIQMF